MYGGNAVGGSETPGSITRVFEIDEGSADEEGHPVNTIVFEGTETEARVYMDARWREGRNYLVPDVMIGAGVLLLLGAFIPFEAVRDRSALAGSHHHDEDQHADIEEGEADPPEKRVSLLRSQRRRTQGPDGSK